jgi:hypothetical protein
VLGLAHGRQGSHQAAPSTVGTMVPTVPMVPRASKTPFCGLVRFGRRVSGFCGRRWLPGRDHPSRWSRHRLRRDTGSGAPWVTPGSFSFGSPASPVQPAVVFAPRDPGPSYLAPFAGAVAGFWLRRWFQTSQVFE